MRTLKSAIILVMAGLAPNQAWSQGHVASLPDGSAHHDGTGVQLPAVFRVQPSIASVAQAEALKGAPSPEDLALKFAIEGSAIELRSKLMICRGC